MYNSFMKILFIGGTGVISSGCIQPVLERGFELYVYNRGNKAHQLPPEVVQLKGDIRDRGKTREVLGSYEFDAIVNWNVFTPEQAEQDIELFSGKTGQYIFISTASAYQKPAVHYKITESTPLQNPYWEYSRKKIAAEQRLMEEYRSRGFPVTIIRPTHTYGENMIPHIYDRGPILLDRLRRGKPVVVPGDGTSWWVVTHNTDFAKGLVGLLGHPSALGQAFHITSEELLTWDQIFSIVAGHLGVEPKLLHIPADFICERYPEFTGPLKGDKIYSVYFDNSKVKELVPGFVCTTPFHVGVEGSVRWFLDHPDDNKPDPGVNAKLDALVKEFTG